MRTAQERASLRAEGQFEKAAEWQTDGFYIGWTSYWIGQGVFAALLAITGIVLAMPVLVFAGVCLAARWLWRAHRSNVEHKEDIEHRRTSKERITIARDALDESGWNR